MSNRRIICLTLAAASVVWFCTRAPAHTGNQGIRVDQQTVVELENDSIRIAYSTQLNRQGAYLEVLRMDLDGDDELSAREQAYYFAELHKGLTSGLEVIVNGEQVRLEPVGETELSMPFKKLYRFELPQPTNWQEGATVELHNDNYLDFPGEITVEINPGSGTDVVYDSRWEQTTEDVQAALPVGGIWPSLQERDVVFRYRRGTGKSEPVDAPEARPPGAAGLTQGEGYGTVGNRGWSLALAVSLLVGVLLSVSATVVCRLRGSPVLRPAAAAGILGFAASLIGLTCIGPSGTQTVAAVMPPDVEAGQIFQRLHNNIYKAFDAGSESAVYDSLALGLDGEVLDQVYNEVYEALMMRGKGNTRFSIRRVKPISTEVLPAQRERMPAFRVRYRWRVYGTVTHLGHTHARFNEYEALYLVKHNGHWWRITDSEVRQHKRVTLGQT